MAEYRKYKMNNPQDYRPNINNHEVRLVKVIDGVDWALGKFTIIDDDMVDLTENEISQLPEIKIPNISLRQCKELLIVTGKYKQVLNILETLPETTPEEETQKLLLKNYWENSQEFERGHQFLGVMTSAIESNSSFNVEMASSLISFAPLVATMTGSTTICFAS